MVSSQLGSGHPDKYSFEIPNEYLSRRGNLLWEVNSITRNRQFNLGFLFQMTISRLAYAAAFSGQLCFWRRHFFSIMTSTQQLFFQNSIEKHFQGKTSTEHHFLIAGSCLGQLHSGTAIFQVEEFFRIKIFTEKLLFSK